jgi:hypothetical protein
MNNIQEDTLIKIYNRLDGIWGHHQDGSDFMPALTGEKYYSQRNQEYIKNYGEQSVLFNIIFNEILPEINKAIPPEKRDKKMIIS